MPLEWEGEIRQNQALQSGRYDGGRPLVSTVEQHGSATHHRGRDALRIRQSDPGFHQYRERWGQRRQRSPLGKRVGHRDRVAGAREKLRHSLEERAVGANE